MATPSYHLDPNDPRAPSTEEWEQMSESQRQRVVDQLPSEVPREMVSDLVAKEQDLARALGEAMAEAEQEKAKAKQEKARAEQERARAEQERAKAEEEKAKAEQEKARADRLAARLRELGLEPDED